MAADPNDVTQLLQAIADGDRDAWAELLPHVDRELRRIASARLGSRPLHSLQVTDLVNETYVELLQRAGGRWQNRQHFYVIAARVVHDLLVDHARRKLRKKRGGDRMRIEWSDDLAVEPTRDEELLALDEALRELQHTAADQHRIVMLRYFGGMSIDEVARTLAVSPSTVDRQWRFARAVLQRHMMAGTCPLSNR